jgi:membrane associated rhomboid family serine protease
LIPLRDNIPTLSFPVLTVALIVINIAVFLWQTQFPVDRELQRLDFGSVDASALEFGAIPYRLTHPSEDECFLGTVPQGGGELADEVVCQGQPELAAAEEIAGETATAPDGQTITVGEPRPLDQPAWWITILTSMFMHGGILHLVGNMLFLWVFGNNIEDSMGKLRFLLFYLLAGAVAVYGQSLLDTSATVPTIGASGAVAGVLGAYALLHPRARVLTLVIIIFFVTLIEIPAMLLLGVWFLLQFLPVLGQTAIPELAGDAGVAYTAHVAGFAFGLLAIKLFVDRRRTDAIRRQAVY